jgi:prefoldin subunit 5
VTSQKRQLDDYERQIESLNAKVIELRETIQTLEKKR